MGTPDRDDLLEHVRHIALALPDAQEKLSHGSPTWFTTKVFATWGAHVKGDHSSDRLRRAVVFLPDADEREALVQDPRFHVPAYYGPSGWLAFDLTHSGVDWDEVAELLDASYRNTAGIKRVRLLDALRDQRNPPPG